MRTPKRVQSRSRQNQNDAADQQPWRCTECGEAVSHINPRPCACIRAARRNADKGAARRNADKVDGYDRDDLGESPDY